MKDYDHHWIQRRGRDSRGMDQSVSFLSRMTIAQKQPSSLLMMKAPPCLSFPSALGTRPEQGSGTIGRCGCIVAGLLLSSSSPARGYPPPSLLSKVLMRAPFPATSWLALHITLSNRFPPLIPAGCPLPPRMASKSKTSFCIDSLLSQDVHHHKVTAPVVVVRHADDDSPPASSRSPPDSSTESASAATATVRFRSNLFGGILMQPGYPPIVESKEADGRPQSSNSSNKEETVTESTPGHQSMASSMTCWQQPHSITRLAYGPVATPSTNGNGIGHQLTPSSSSPTSSGNGTAYSSTLFTNPAAALHAAAAAAAAAVAASSPSAHQFHSAHLEWLARAGVLYHRFGADLSGKPLVRHIQLHSTNLNNLITLSTCSRHKANVVIDTSYL